MVRPLPVEGPNSLGKKLPPCFAEHLLLFDVFFLSYPWPSGIMRLFVPSSLLQSTVICHGFPVPFMVIRWASQIFLRMVPCVSPQSTASCLYQNERRQLWTLMPPLFSAMKGDAGTSWVRFFNSNQEERLILSAWTFSRD